MSRLETKIFFPFISDTYKKARYFSFQIFFLFLFLFNFSRVFSCKVVTKQL